MSGKAARIGLVGVGLLEPRAARPERAVGIEFDPHHLEAVAVKPAGWLRDFLKRAEAIGIDHQSDAQATSVAKEDFLRLGELPVTVGVGGVRHGPFDQAPRIIDEQAVFYPPARRGCCGSGHASGLHCGAVDDDRVAVDPFEHDWPVTDDSIEVDRGWKAFDRPQFLVPSKADDPARIGIGHGVRAEPFLQLVERPGADEVQLKSAFAKPEHMPVRVDQAGKHRPPSSIDDIRVAKLEQLAVKHVLHLAVIADQDSGEVLQPSVRIDLDAVEVVDQRVGMGGRCEQRCGEREERSVHGASHSIVRAALKV
jgi:hypothetical protein